MQVSLLVLEVQTDPEISWNGLVITMQTNQGKVATRDSEGVGGEGWMYIYSLNILYSLLYVVLKSVLSEWK